MTSALFLRPRVTAFGEKTRARCACCGDPIRVRRGAFQPHNWGMRLCPGSWQLVGQAERSPMLAGGVAAPRF